MKAREKEKHVVTELPVDRLLSTDEVGEALGTTRTLVNRMVNAGMMVALYFGRNKRVPTSALNAFIEEYAGHDIVAELERAEKIEAERKRALA